MSKRGNHNFNLPEGNLYLIIIGLLCVSVFFYNGYLGGISLIIFAYLTYHNFKVSDLRKKEWSRYLQNLSLDIDDTTKKAILHLPMPLCILEFDGTVSWYNNKFVNTTQVKDMIGMNIEELVPNLNLRKVLNEQKELYTNIEYNGKYYNIVYNIVKSQKDTSNAKYMIMVYWIDKSDYSNLAKKYLDEKEVLGLLQIDSYDEVLQSAPEDKRPLLMAEVDRTIKSWGNKNNIALRKNGTDKYVLITNKSTIDKLEEEKFLILDDIREIDEDNTLPVTLSIGIGLLGKNSFENMESAIHSLDLALGRGGDQAVIKKLDKTIFFGGRSKAVEKKTRVKARLIAFALKNMIKESQKIYIMGHKYPDLDALGAAIGVHSICKQLGKESQIVLKNSNSSIDLLIDRINKDESYDYSFIKGEEAIKFCDKDTLLVVVDTHRPSFTECPELLDISEKVVLIDHHRRGVEFISDAVLTYHETYASSTCEMVTELIQYISDRNFLTKLEAEALLSGITLDTKNFNFKTGVRTFEAAATLRKRGADPTSVKKLFQGDFDNFLSKAEVIKNVKIIGNKMALSICPDDVVNPQLVIAQGADELLNVKGVRASIVLGQGEDGVIFVSARSLGDINVQVLMEKLNGGGHIDVAGAQFKDISMDEALEQVEELIIDYLKEES